MQLTLYVIPGSHPCAAVEVALRRKGLDYRRVDLPPLLSIPIGYCVYGARTVPGLVVADGPVGRERIAGSREIMRQLDRLVPEAPLLPDDPERRAELLEIERWGDEVLQSLTRRIVDVCLMRCPAAMESYAAEAHLPLPLALVRPAAPLVVRGMALLTGANEQRGRDDLQSLPDHLTRVDAWIADGLLGGEEPNAADLQVGSSLWLLHSFEDVRPLVESHRCDELRRYFPPIVGSVPAGTLPAEWVPAAAAA
jgi:glutathione S-transferase